jgi:hypothetical protein
MKMPSMFDLVIFLFVVYTFLVTLKDAGVLK